VRPECLDSLAGVFHLVNKPKRDGRASDLGSSAVMKDVSMQHLRTWHSDKA